MNEIREVREKLGVSRRELCESIDLPYRTLEDWECERKKPSVWAVKLIIEKIENIAKEKAKMKKYIIVDDTTSKRSSIDTYIFDNEKEAIEKAGNIVAHLTEKDKNDRDGFYVGIGILDEDGNVDFDSIDVIKEYI